VKRVLSVLLLAALTATVSGLEETPLAAQPPAAEQQQAPGDDILLALAGAKVGDVVRIETLDGTKLKGRLVTATRDGITLAMGKGGGSELKTLRLDEVRKVSKGGGHRTRNIVLITLGVLVGACTASYASAGDMNHAIPKAASPTSAPASEETTPPSAVPTPDPTS
jgi:hypothetical protein